MISPHFVLRFTPRLRGTSVKREVVFLGDYFETRRLGHAFLLAIAKMLNSHGANSAPCCWQNTVLDPLRGDF